MTNQLTTTNSNPFQIFNHPAFGFVRVVVKDGEPWFVGKDVAEVLGYKDQEQAIRKHVDTEDKAIFKGVETTVLDFNIPNRGLTIINESGLYSLMLRSKLPQARDFKRWVTSEVLPSIRKHGGYLTPDKLEEVLTDPDTLVKLALQLKRLPYLTYKRFYLPCPYVSLRPFNLFLQMSSTPWLLCHINLFAFCATYKRKSIVCFSLYSPFVGILERSKESLYSFLHLFAFL